MAGQCDDDKINMVCVDSDIHTLANALISDELQELVGAARDAWACHYWDDEDDRRKASLERLIVALKPFNAVMV